MKINNKQRNDYNFLLNSDIEELKTGDLFGENLDDPNGESALYCFVAKDTHGKTVPCRDSKVLQSVINKKKAWNRQIKDYAESIAEGTLFVFELDDMGLPNWIKKASINQSKKILSEKFNIDCSTIKKYKDLHGLDLLSLIRMSKS